MRAIAIQTGNGLIIFFSETNYLRRFANFLYEPFPEIAWAAWFAEQTTADHLILWLKVVLTAVLRKVNLFLHVLKMIIKTMNYKL